MPSELYVGIDVGTTVTKAGVFDNSWNMVGTASIDTAWSRVPTGAEIDPGILARGAITAATEALARAGEGTVAALGVTGMAETGVVARPDAEPDFPAIAWHDARGAAEETELVEDLGASFTSATGLPPTRLSSLVKYRWMRRHFGEPAAGARWYTVAEWVVRELGGLPGAERSLLSRTGFVDIFDDAAYTAGLEWAGASPEMLGDFVWAGAPAGRVDRGPDALRGAMLTVAGMDHQCAAFGIGAVDPGDTFDSCGTAEAIVRAALPDDVQNKVAEAVAGGVTVGWHVVPNRIALLGGFGCGLVLQPLLDLLSAGADARDVERLGTAALELEDAGVRVELDKNGTVKVLGLRDGISPAQVWRAGLDFVGSLGTEVIRTVESIAGPSRRIVATGGWMYNRAYRERKHHHLGPFEWSQVDVSGTLGAAKLSAIAAGALEPAAGNPAP